ncbi:MAG: hypothetical protein J0L91_11070 [Burkholderiales bacterium]|nr:hypothetical protein [Burkholderiales bacterium]
MDAARAARRASFSARFRCLALMSSGARDRFGFGGAAGGEEANPATGIAANVSMSIIEA